MTPLVLFLTIIQGLCLFSHVSDAKLLTQRNKRDIASVGNCINECQKYLEGEELTWLCKYNKHAKCIGDCVQNLEVFRNSELPGYMKSVGEQLCDFRDVIIGTHVCRTQAKTKNDLNSRCKVQQIKGVDQAANTHLEPYCNTVRFALRCITPEIKKNCVDDKGAVYAETLLYAYKAIEFAIRNLHDGKLDMSFGPEHADCETIIKTAAVPLSDDELTSIPTIAQPPSTSTEPSTDGELQETEEPAPSAPGDNSATLSPHYITAILSSFHAIYFLF
ncbi:hypothetical protein DdX_19551 [Ditylenchus destructor]|uniref:Uncharacterized protein n=1 Tax=Ditylenchus destructor TaxID=166010 RepID=A0AAD4MK93_9BILA|nr:hypothetical protein DdX_19551 [Ditylenchus destructor]